MSQVKKRIAIAAALLAIVGYYIFVRETAIDAQHVVVASAQIPELSPEVIEAINRKFGVVTVEVPLRQVVVKPPARTTKILGFFEVTTQRGEFLSGGKMFVGFEGSRIDTSNADFVEITLGKPVFRGLDDTFVTLSLYERDLFEHDPRFVDDARAKGRKTLLNNACTDGYYQKAALAGAAIMKSFVEGLQPGANVVIHITEPEAC